MQVGQALPLSSCLSARQASYSDRVGIGITGEQARGLSAVWGDPVAFLEWLIAGAHPAVRLDRVRQITPSIG